MKKKPSLPRFRVGAKVMCDLFTTPMALIVRDQKDIRHKDHWLRVSADPKGPTQLIEKASALPFNQSFFDRALSAHRAKARTELARKVSELQRVRHDLTNAQNLFFLSFTLPGSPKPTADDFEDARRCFDFDMRKAWRLHQFHLRRHLKRFRREEKKRLAKK